MKYKIFIVLLILFFINDYYLSFYGRGNNLLKTKILYGFNLDFDSLEGYKIEEEEFIQVIGYGTVINDELTVKKFIKYAINKNSIFCEVIDKKDNSNLIKITFNENRNKGNKINFQKINNYKFYDTLEWYDLTNSKLAIILNFSYFILKILLIIFILIFIYKFFFK